MLGFLVPHPPLIIPGIGNGDEIPETRRAYKKAASEAEEYRPDTYVVISPHSVLYSDYIHISPGDSAEGDFGNFRMGKISFHVEYDNELAAEIARLAAECDISAGFEGETDSKLDHGVMVPLRFFDVPKIVRISISGMSFIEHYRFGMCISAAAEALDRKICVIASGDMSHKLKSDGPYGFAKQGPEHDEYIRKCIEASDIRGLMSVDPILCEKAAECGTRTIIMMLGAFDGKEVQSELLHYESPYGVGYLTAAFRADGNAPSLLSDINKDRHEEIIDMREKEDAYVSLARNNIENLVSTGKDVTLPDDLPDELTASRAGVFVTIKKDGELRGCIGTISPTRKSIADEILGNSRSAALHDPRFAPVQPKELDSLTYSVDVLMPPEKIQDEGQLDPSRYGVIVSCGGRRGLLLPDLDGVDTIGEQVGIALRKGGISRDESYELERFEVIRHGQK